MQCLSFDLCVHTVHACTYVLTYVCAYVCRYIVGVLFCVVALLVIVCVALGLTCGVAGFNKDRLPFERTSLSNCGGVCLLA